MSDATRPKPFVFVLMPLSKEFDDVYYLGIKPACKEIGSYAERVDEQIFHESILERIYNQISKADIIISDMTGRNPNVFYETGYAHALGKRVVLLTQNADDIPFDLKHYYHIIYGGRIVELIPELRKRIKWLLDNPLDKSINQSDLIVVYVDNVCLKGNPLIEYPINGPTNRYDFIIDFNNSLEREIFTTEFQIGLIAESTIEFCFGNDNKSFRMFNQPDGRTIVVPKNKFSIMPGAWDKFSMNVVFKNIMKIGDTEELAIRIFTSGGISDYPFSLRFTEKQRLAHDF